MAHPVAPASGPSTGAAPTLNQQLRAATAEQELLLDLQQYPLRTRRTLTLLWLFTGIVGGHRYYLHRVGSGVIMTLTYGMGGVWWLLDGLRLGKMLEAYNGEQNFRRKRGLPPMELDFMPTLDTRILERRPPWFMGAVMAKPRLGRDLLVVGLVGLLLGAICAEDSLLETNYEPIVGLGALLLLVNAEDQLLRWRRHRVVQEVLQWYLKLKLYYHQNAVPSPVVLLLRPFVGLFTVAFRRRRSGEARLYMELGVVFTVVFGLWSLITGEYWSMIGQGEYTNVLREWLGSTVQQFFLMYTCVTPIGATFLKHDLMGQGPRTRRLLTLATVGALLLGLGMGMG